MFDLISVGHITIDSISLPGRDTVVVALGGSVAYVSLAARFLDATVSVISKVGMAFKEEYLEQLRKNAVDLSGLMKVENAETTRFRLKYDDYLSKRELYLDTMAPPITIEDLPEHLTAKVIHVAPVAGEIAYETVDKLRKYARKLSLDPQGFLRAFNKKGRVTLNSPADKRILELVDIYKSSSDEVKALTGLSNLKSAINTIHGFGVETVIITLGNKGAMLSFDETIYMIPAYRSKNIVDPTGAGDVFIGAFLAEYILGKSVLWGAYVGSAAASLAIEVAGSLFSSTQTDIRQRAYALYKERDSTNQV
jgi:sugar/nucleoside kinase (ribokinase family)